MNLKIYAALLVASLFLAQAFAQGRTSRGPVAHDKAVFMARQAAIEHGYDLEKYSLLPNSNKDLSEDGKEWLFLYVCKKPSVDCGFSISVSLTTGVVEVHSLP